MLKVFMHTWPPTPCPHSWQARNKQVFSVRLSGKAPCKLTLPVPMGLKGWTWCSNRERIEEALECPFYHSVQAKFSNSGLPTWKWIGQFLFVPCVYVSMGLVCYQSFSSNHNKEASVWEESLIKLKCAINSLVWTGISISYWNHTQRFCRRPLSGAEARRQLALRVRQTGRWGMPWVEGGVTE